MIARQSTCAQKKRESICRGVCVCVCVYHTFRKAMKGMWSKAVFSLTFLLPEHTPFKRPHQQTTTADGTNTQQYVNMLFKRTLGGKWFRIVRKESNSVRSVMSLHSQGASDTSPRVYTSPCIMKKCSCKYNCMLKINLHSWSHHIHVHVR